MVGASGDPQTALGSFGSTSCTGVRSSSSASDATSKRIDFKIVDLRLDNPPAQGAQESESDITMIMEELNSQSGSPQLQQPEPLAVQHPRAVAAQTRSRRRSSDPDVIAEYFMLQVSGHLKKWGLLLEVN